MVSIKLELKLSCLDFIKIYSIFGDISGKVIGGKFWCEDYSEQFDMLL